MKIHFFPNQSVHSCLRFEETDLEDMQINLIASGIELGRLL